MTAWYEQSFGEDYLLVYKHRSQREASEQVEAILPLLQVKPGSRILDLCCGTGRHAVELAAKVMRSLDWTCPMCCCLTPAAIRAACLSLT